MRRRPHESFETETTRNKWDVALKEKTKLGKLLSEKTDKDLGMVRLDSLRSLQGNKWLHSEIVDGAFKLLEKKINNTKSFSYILFQRKNNESLYGEVLRQVSTNTDNLIFPIIEHNHWFSACIVLSRRVIVVLDTLYKFKRSTVF